MASGGLFHLCCLLSADWALSKLGSRVHSFWQTTSPQVNSQQVSTG